MVDSIFGKFIAMFNFSVKEMVVLALLVFILYFTFTTNSAIQLMEARYQDDIYHGAEGVLITLQKLEIETPEAILEFLAPKPAGKNNLRKGVTDKEIYEKLYEVYGELAKNAKIAFSY